MGGQPITGPVAGAVWQWNVEAPTYDEAIARIKESGYFCGGHDKRFVFYAWSDSMLVAGGFTEVSVEQEQGAAVEMGDSGRVDVPLLAESAA